MNQNDIVLITCEASLDPEVSFEFERDWGISQYELRQVFSPDTRVPYFSPKEQENGRFSARANSIGASNSAL